MFEFTKTLLAGIKEYIDSKVKEHIMIDETTGYKYRVKMVDGKIVYSLTIHENSVAITSQPTKTVYMSGEEFVPTGITGTVNINGVEKTVNDFSYLDGDMETAGENAIRVACIENGEIYTGTVTVKIISLVDFVYTANDDGTYTITNWKGTKDGITSTEMIFPDDPSIILSADFIGREDG